MDILISNLPYRVTEADVVRSVAAVVHSDGFPRRQVQVEVGEGDTIHRLINFKVQLNPSPAGGVGNNGMGVLTLPDIGAGNAFLRWVQNDGIKMDERKITFKKGRGRPSSSLVQTLDRTRYIPPEIEEERLRKRQQLHHRFHLDDVQSGVLFRPTYPTTDNQPLTQQEFSTEWTFDCVKKGGGCLEFEHDHRLIRIKVFVLSVTV
jgi:RNA-dependent RNA polymerase